MQINEVKGTYNATGANIYFEAKGNGENILLIHAGIADSRMWDKEFHLLSEKYRVVRVDLPGFGLSDFTGGNYSYSNIINEILIHLNIKRTHILAASFGGKIAIDFYLENSEKCLSLALLSPAIGGWEDSSFLQKYEEEEEELLQEGKIEETVTDLTELQNNVTNEIINSMTMKFNELQTDLTETVKQINGSDNKAEDVEQLKKENEALKRKYDTLTQDYQKLHNDLSQIANMSIWEFRKWKKINEYNEYFMFRLTIKT